MFKYLHHSKEEKILINILFKKKKLDVKVFSKLDYDKLVKIASSHLVLPALYINIKKKKYIRNFPKDLIKYLKEIYTLNKKRNILLIKESSQISKLLKSENIKYQYIKGANHILNDIYDDIGERMIGDIDLLTENSYSNKIEKLLKDSGYKSNKVETRYWKKKHKPKLVNYKKIFAIEIHDEVLIYSFRKILPGTEVLNGNEYERTKNLIKLCILNFQINDYGYLSGNYSLRTIYDYIKLCKNEKFFDESKYFKRFFLITNTLGITNINFKLSFFDKIFLARINFKRRNSIYFFLDEFLCDIIKLTPRRFWQFLEFIFNKNYRDSILKN